jgi:hypothetical protein
MTDCMPQVVDLCRTCRLHVSWPVTGVGGTDVADASLDGGVTWVPLTLAGDQATVIGYFAGPGYSPAGAAAVVPKTSHVTIRIITVTETLTFPGGFIRITD